jgi:hypothetical protein
MTNQNLTTIEVHTQSSVFFVPQFCDVGQVVIIRQNTFSQIWQCSKYESRKIISTLPHNIIVVSVGNDVLQVMLKVNGARSYITCISWVHSNVQKILDCWKLLHTHTQEPNEREGEICLSPGSI